MIPRLKRTFSTFKNGSLPFDPFEVLGVTPSCSQWEVKKSFYRLIKKHHPDVSPHDNKKEYLKILQSYEILQDPVLRADYILRHRPLRAAAAAGHNNDSIKKNRNEGPGVNPFDAKASFNEGLRRRKGYRFSGNAPGDQTTDDQGGAGGRRGRRRRGDGDDHWLSPNGLGLLDTLEEEFDAAITHAYLGPLVERGTIPYAFECEERIGKEHSHILEMTSGQQLLGWVKASDDLLRLEHKAGVSRATRSSGDNEDHRKLPLFQYWDGLAFMEASNFIPLDLVWAENKTIARSIRCLDPLSGDDVILIQTYMGEEEESMVSGDFQSETYAVRGIARAGLLSRHPVENLKKQKATHTLITHKTPLVRHMHFVQGGEGGLIECRAIRGDWRLPRDYLEETLAFHPRSLSHNKGGWYIERGVSKGNSMCLPPALYILICAYRCLDKEEAENEKEKGEKKPLAKLKDFVRGYFTSGADCDK